ncbi:hypothetical protein Y032_0477g2164 [Ancylostoma ceylanicum]|uniref:Uncharacterized protein n=1 Tax=Ancylostoma ceylanicum TaxID=53326 RepID=A0A016WWA8_9BILA|nr:hypothetical protein Y032_0477g2164 [Ancylostoma ceylanicum]
MLHILLQYNSLDSRVPRERSGLSVTPTQPHRGVEARSNTPLAGVNRMPGRKDRLRLCAMSVQSPPKIDWRI